MKKYNELDEKPNFLIYVPEENKRRFKAMCARSGLNMKDVINDLIINVMNNEKYEIKK